VSAEASKCAASSVLSVRWQKTKNLPAPKKVRVQSEKYRGPSACQPRCYCSRRTENRHRVAIVLSGRNAVDRDAKVLVRTRKSNRRPWAHAA